MKKQKVTSLLAMAVIAMVFVSCATIISGGNPKITIDGETPGPVTIYTEVDTYKDVLLPYVVQVNRHQLDGQKIKIKSDSIDYQDIIIFKKVNGWAFGNILLGGVIGWGVDLITNCVSRPEKTRFLIEEKPIQRPKE